ncbi:MAG TPA: ABC transporter substrate-binding protein [Lachnospiraceae bacterium]|nr:ABC transporter substrate-binding protein [Lachnospiraceae bacterium]
MNIERKGKGVMKKKIISAVLSAAMIAGLLSGCGSDAKAVSSAQEPESTETSASSEEPVEINMFIASPEYADAINELIAAYKEVKPNVTINYETTQNDYPTLLKTKLNAGECPDIFSSTSGKEIVTYLDYSYDLSGQPLADAMSDSVADVMKSGDGLYGLSIKGNYFGLLYNKAIFEECGISEFPQTLDDLEAACEKIQAKGYQPFTTGYAEWWVFKHTFQSFLDAAGKDDVEGLVNKFAAGEAHFSDYPELYDDFFRYLDMTVKYGDAKPLETDLSAEDAAFGSGQAAIMNGQGAWVEADVLAIDQNIQIGFDGYPVGSDASLCKVIGGSDQALRVYKDSKVLDDVLDFVNWWYTSDYGKAWFNEVAGVIPPIDDAAAPDFAVIKQGNELASAEGTNILSIVYSTDSFHQAFGEVLQSYIAGTIDKDTACAQIEEKWTELEGGN